MTNLLFITHYTDLYGANRSLLTTLKHIDKNKYKPYVLIPTRGKIEELLQELEIEYTIICFKVWMAKNRTKAIPRLIVNLFSLYHIGRYIKLNSIELIYSNSSVIPIGQWIALLLKLPHVWHIREFGWQDYKLKYDFGKTIFNYFLSKSDAVIAVSNTIMADVLGNVNCKKTVIYNGIFDGNNNNRYYKIPDYKDFKFGIIGVLRPEKGQHIAVKAFNELLKIKDNIRLIIAGDGEDNYLNKLKISANEVGQEKVKFLGYVDNPTSFYREIDCLVVCSKYEAMGRVTVEGMYHSLPVIGYNSAGTKEIINNNINGILYNGSIENLCNKMGYVIDNDMSRIREKAYQDTLQRFTINKYVNQVSDIITDIIDE